MQINTLKIYTQNLNSQKKFYSTTLGFEILNESDTDINYKIGKSVLHIETGENSAPYHFAFNIPSNKENEALEFLKKKKVSILKDGKNELQHFEDWNAVAMYFYDADNNIVEFIARKELKNDKKGKFDGHSLLEISEIGFATNSIQSEFDQLNEYAELEVFSGDMKDFCAVGSENGMLICVNTKTNKWFPTNDKSSPTNFEIIITNNETDYKIHVEDEDLNVYLN